MPISLNGNSHLPVPLEDITQPSVTPETFDIAYLHYLMNILNPSVDIELRVSFGAFTVEITPDSQLRLITKLPPGF